MSRTTFTILGMRCKSCVAKITNEVEAIYGVIQVVINLEASSGFVIHSNNVLPQTIQKHIMSLNFEAELVETIPEENANITPARSEAKSATVSYRKGDEEVKIKMPTVGEGLRLSLIRTGFSGLGCKTQPGYDYAIGISFPG